MRSLTNMCKIVLVLSGLFAMVAACQGVSASVQCDTAGATMLLPLPNNDSQVLSVSAQSTLIVSLDEGIRLYKVALTDLDTRSGSGGITSLVNLSTSSSTAQIFQLADLMTQKVGDIKDRHTGSYVGALNELMASVTASEGALLLHLSELDKAIDTATPEDRVIIADRLDHIQSVMEKLQAIHNALYGIKFSTF